MIYKPRQKRRHAQPGGDMDRSDHQPAWAPLLSRICDLSVSIIVTDVAPWTQIRTELDDSFRSTKHWLEWAGQTSALLDKGANSLSANEDRCEHTGFRPIGLSYPNYAYPSFTL
ncbi:hypothetical protein FRB94_001236 [Tulasnella sp. JGI-2019a]|nr:hypothetical protein FRB94_001236 [Tulasnella sp. JGI-2019a]